jgi:hypothetical protein
VFDSGAADNVDNDIAGLLRQSLCDFDQEQSYNYHDGVSYKTASLVPVSMKRLASAESAFFASLFDTSLRFVPAT